ncbi:MAG: cryptochrome/photolyase family protein [Halioglobus sp.]
MATAQASASRGAALVLVLGDQLTPGRGALKDAVPGRDVVVMAEVSSEARYVPHNRHKIVLLFSAMRHFRDELRALGFTVHYFSYTNQGPTTLLQAVQTILRQCDVTELRCCEPGEYRLLSELQQWALPIPVRLIADERFLCTRDAFASWAQGRKQLRMEYFYREMRKQYQLLLDDRGGPQGGRWNYDADNRHGWRSQETIPPRPPVILDEITKEVMALVSREFPEHPGDLEQFYLAVTREEANLHFRWFLDNGLRHFGTYQDAMADDSPWLFHSLVSMYLNIGLLDPLDVCRQVEEAWRRGRCELSAAEGFIRQVLGWREYVRGVYWLSMPGYAERNALQAQRPLPPWFWTGATDMRCLHVAIRQTLDLGYAHHIQRLMVIGNFALLAGLHVKSVCDWYLAVYVDAFEWVELPNTLGMALYADDGLMASKPYAASGKYIQRQGDHCKACRYSPGKTTGDDACPYNSLYWRFVHRHQDALKGNPRMSLVLKNWERKTAGEKHAIVAWANAELTRLVPETDTP